MSKSLLTKSKLYIFNGEKIAYQKSTYLYKKEQFFKSPRIETRNLSGDSDEYYFEYYLLSDEEKDNPNKIYDIFVDNFLKEGDTLILKGFHDSLQDEEDEIPLYLLHNKKRIYFYNLTMKNRLELLYKIIESAWYKSYDIDNKLNKKENLELFLKNFISENWKGITDFYKVDLINEHINYINKNM